MRRGPNNKMWVVETVCAGNGGEGMYVVMKKTKEEAIAWVLKRCPQENIVKVETFIGMEFVEIRGERGEMAYFRTYGEKPPKERGD